LSSSTVGAAFLLGLGLSAFFWLPAFLEKGFVLTDLLRQDFLRWSEHTDLVPMPTRRAGRLVSIASALAAAAVMAFFDPTRSKSMR
jgi:hypothetical protein